MDGNVVTFNELSEGDVIRLLYNNAANGVGRPDHYDAVWERSKESEGAVASAADRDPIGHGGKKYSIQVRTDNTTEKTRFCTVNVSGSLEFLSNALAIEADVIFIQEHRRRAKDIATWRTAARHKGWHGVWSYADTTDKGAASGGVAILVRLGRPIFTTPAANDARFVGAVISWTRRVKMHLYSVYGYDCGKEDAAGKNRAFHRSISQEITRIGRVPWIMGGDWNITPAEIHLGNVGGLTVLSPGTATADTGSELDWFITNMDYGVKKTPEILYDAGVTVHRPVIMEVPRSINGDLGSRLKRPRAFKGVLKSELKGFEPEPGPVVTLPGDHQDRWREWNEVAEKWLAEKEEAEGDEYRGRGTELGYIKNTVSAPQVGEDAIAGSAEVKSLLSVVNTIQRLMYLEREGKDGGEEAAALRRRLSHIDDLSAAAIGHRQKIDELRKQIVKERSERWKTWAKETWATKKKAIYRWVGGKTIAATEQHMSEGQFGPHVSDRIRNAVDCWSRIWNKEGVEPYLPNFNGVLPPITGARVRAVLNRMTDGKAKGYDSWSPAELRALPDTLLSALAELLNDSEELGKWPSLMGRPIVALIPKPGAEHEGEMRPIALLPYVYRLWMCIRKRDVERWALGLHGGKFRSAEALAWELAAKGEAARLEERHFVAAFLDCSRCYERVAHGQAGERAVETGCNPKVVNLAMDMYGAPRVIQAHGAHSELVGVNRGMLAGCGFAVHFLKAIVIKILESSEVETRDFVDDLVLHSDSPSKEQVVLDMQSAIETVAGALEGYHQVVNKAKEQVFVSSADLAKIWKKIDPAYQGAIGGSVKDLGITIRTPGKASVNRNKRVSDGSVVNRRIGALPFAIRDKVTMVKTAGLSRSLFGAHVDPLNCRQLRAVRMNIRASLWPGKTSVSPTGCLLVADKGELEPWVSIVKRTVVSWKRRVQAGLPDYVVRTWTDGFTAKSRVKGPVDYTKRVFGFLGWRTEGGLKIIDHKGHSHEVVKWHNMVPSAVARARQVLWRNNEKFRRNYKGVAKGVDERTTTRYYRKVAKSDQKRAGAIHTVLSDGWWNPDRANKRGSGKIPKCVLCGCPKGDLDHLAWSCPRINRVTDLGYVQLKRERAQLEGEPKCLWRTGVATSDFTAMPESPYVREEDPVGITGFAEPKGHRDIYTDGAAYTYGSTTYAGWGVHDPKGAATSCGPVYGEEQTPARGEVRAIVQVAEAVSEQVTIVADNLYAVNAANDIIEGRNPPENTHMDLWDRFAVRKQFIRAVKWIKSHMKPGEAHKRGFTEHQRLQNEYADHQAKAGAEKHGYTDEQKRVANRAVGLVGRIQRHLTNTYIKYINNKDFVKDSKVTREAARKKVRTTVRGRPRNDPALVGHDPLEKGEYQYCMKCGRSTHSKDKRVFWVNKKCEPIDQFIKYRDKGHRLDFGEKHWKCLACGIEGKRLQSIACGQNEQCHKGAGGKRRGGPVVARRSSPPVKRARLGKPSLSLSFG